MLFQRSWENAGVSRAVRIENQPLLASDLEGQARRASTSQPPQNSQPVEEKLLRNKARESSLANSTSSFNPILFLQTKGIHVIDRRDKGGGIWVAGGEELRATMDFLLKRGFPFRFYPGGLHQKSNGTSYAADGWFIKSL